MDFVISRNTSQSGDMLDQFKALSCDVRLEILTWLADPQANFPDQEAPEAAGEGVCVSQIQRKAKLSPSTTSAHLAILQRAGLVRSTRIGQWTYYARDDEALRRLANGICDDI
jgi:ArsR family transcriptional regulator